MGDLLLIFILLCSFFFYTVLGQMFSVQIIPRESVVVLGGTVQFEAKLYQGSKLASNNKYYFSWSDNAEPPHESTIESQLPYSNWTITYDREKYKAKKYKIKVSVNPIFWLPYYTVDATAFVIITKYLNGNLLLLQNDTVRDNEYVSSLEQVNHTIVLNTLDQNYLLKEATYVYTYWFKNCTYLGRKNGLSIINIYDRENEEHVIEAVVVVSFEKIPDPITTTTIPTTELDTTNSTDTKKTTAEANYTNSSITIKQTDSTSTPKKRIRRQNKFNYTINQQDSAPNTILDIKELTEQTNYKQNEQASVNIVSSIHDTEVKNIRNIKDKIALKVGKKQFICLNDSSIASDNNKTYGYFYRKIIAKIPVSNLTATGSNWLQRGDVLNLRANCTGSPPFMYCVNIILGPHNITTNESCTTWYSSNTCNFAIIRYLRIPKTHTVIFSVKNPVSQVINQVAVNFYEAKKQSQLSVIVVPVSFSLVAVILVIFGVAYYIQNQKRLTVEVADFNFGETQSVDMEYKTFQQRLFASIREVFRRPIENQNPAPSISGESSLKYGSMK